MYYPKSISCQVLDGDYQHYRLMVWCTNDQIWLPARWASGFSGDHQQNHQCLCFLDWYQFDIHRVFMCWMPGLRSVLIIWSHFLCMSKPIREDVTSVTSSLIGWDLPETCIRNGPWTLLPIASMSQEDVHYYFLTWLNEILISCICFPPGILTFVNAQSVRWATKIQDIFTMAKLLALGIIIVTGITMMCMGE